MAKTVNIAFKIDEDLYLQYKAVIAAYNAEARTRYNVSNELLAHIKRVVDSKTLEFYNFSKSKEEEDN